MQFALEKFLTLCILNFQHHSSQTDLGGEIPGNFDLHESTLAFTSTCAIRCPTRQSSVQNTCCVNAPPLDHHRTYLA